MEWPKMEALLVSCPRLSVICTDAVRKATYKRQIRLIQQSWQLFSNVLGPTHS